MAGLLPTLVRQLRRQPFAIRAHSSQPYRYNYIADEFSEEEPTTLTQVISQFSSASSIKLYSTNELARFNHPPRPSICLARDFIHDSLYNPNYGYFFNQVEIFDRTTDQLQAALNPSGHSDWSKSFEDDLYAEYFDPTSGQQQNQLLVRRQRPDDQLAEQAPPPDPSHSNQRQIWHTPTELFKPWYAWSMASYIVEKHLEEAKRNHQPLKELKIYEIGAGNGTLCVGILDYIKEHHERLYAVTRYTTIELSTRLAERQRAKIRLSGHEGRARVVNRSILGLAGTPELKSCPESCWVLGMEVLDNLSRDVIRHDRVSGQALQSIVITDHHGDYHERFIPITPQNNPTLLAYLKVFNSNPNHHHHQQSQARIFFEQLLAKYLPFRSNLTNHQFIPTNYLILLQTIFNLFPNHRLILSDFSHLPNTLNDSCSNQSGAPVVQTRYNGLTVPASTFLVKPGMFDIFFPTNFDELIKLYNHLYHHHQQQKQESHGGVQHEEQSVNVALHDQNQFLVDLLSSPSMQEKIKKKSEGAVLDLDRIFAYYQNVKVLTVT